ncbi:Neuronal PAS domain-containing protein 4, partial [Ophiophagus hannah]
MYRSTKGASKARRDQINAEIRHLKDLLPIAEGDKLRLSYLHIMSLACIYTRKSIFFSKGATLESLESLLSSQDLDDFMQTLPGFLLVFTGEGKLIYVSESVAEHLGHSMVDLVAQGDSIYDIIDPADHLVMKTQLALPSPLNTGSVIFHLGFEKSELFCKSWYSLIHPEDLSHASAQHYRLSWCLKQQLSAEGSQGPYALESTTTFLESLLSPGQLSSPDQVFTPGAGTPTATLAAPTFDFSTAGVPEGPSAFGEPPEGLPEEMMEPGNISSIEDAPPGSSLSLLVKEPGFGYIVLPQGGYGQAFASEKPAGSKPTSKDLICTPPYTPHQSSAFLFGAPEVYGGGPAALPPGTASSANSPAGLAAVTELFYAQEPCNVLYEKLPPTPDSPGNGGCAVMSLPCAVMSLPEIRGPLYVDVPMVPEGILTPEASPIKQTFFRYSEKEKNEIERLAQQICSLAETFGSAASRGRAEDGRGALREEDPPAPGPGLSPVPEPRPDFQRPKTWRSVDFSLLTCLEEDLLVDENALETLLQDLSSFLFEKGGAGMRCPHHQFCGGDVSSPIGLDTEDSSPGAFALSPRMDLAPEEPCFLEDLTSFETAFETRASNSPCEGLDELYQLQSQGPKGFQEASYDRRGRVAQWPEPSFVNARGHPITLGWDLTLAENTQW